MASVSRKARRCCHSGLIPDANERRFRRPSRPVRTTGASRRPTGPSRGTRERCIALFAEEAFECIPREVEGAVLAAAPGRTPGVIAPHSFLVGVNAEQLNFVAASYLRGGSEPALAVWPSVVERVVPIDAENSGAAHQAAQQLIEAERVRVACDILCLHRRLHDGQPGAARVIGRVLAGNLVQPRRGLVEGDRVRLRQIPTPYPEGLGHEHPGHRVPGAGSKLALVERIAVPFVADGFDRCGTGRERAAPRVVLDMATQATGACPLSYDFRDRLHRGPPLVTSSLASAKMGRC